MTIAIVEDEENTLEQISDFVKKYGAERGESFEIFAFSDGLDLFESYKPNYDILLMDIEMPHSNGMEIAQRIRNVDKTICILFITNLAKYAIEGYSVGAIDYILKPVRYDSFSFRFGRAVEFVRKQTLGKINIIVQKNMIRLDIRDIYFLESLGHNVIYHTAHGTFKTWDTLRNAQNKLPEKGFVKCNNSYLVQLKYVRGVDKDIVVVADKELKIGRKYKKDFIRAVMEYV